MLVEINGTNCTNFPRCTHDGGEPRVHGRNGLRLVLALLALPVAEDGDADEENRDEHERRDGADHSVHDGGAVEPRALCRERRTGKDRSPAGQASGRERGTALWKSTPSQDLTRVIEKPAFCIVSDFLSLVRITLHVINTMRSICHLHVKD